MKKFLTCAIAVVTVFAISVMPAFAAAGVDSSYAGTTYTATLSAGAEGKGGTITISSNGVRNAYSKADLESFAALGADSKYFVKGVRLSGTDTSNYDGYYTPDISAATLTEDEEYVVAYGLTSDKVEYTVRYVTADGRELHEADVFYGNAGDQPVIGYRYFDGYYPNALNVRFSPLTDGGNNTWTFTYYPGTSAPVTTTTTTTVLPAPATAAVDNGTATGAVTEDGTVVAGDANVDANTATADGVATEGGAAVDDGNQVNVQAIDDEEVPAASQELVEMEDEKTPTADIDATSAKKAFPLVASLCVAAAAVVAIVITLTVAKKKNA